MSFFSDIFSVAAPILTSVVLGPEAAIAEDLAGDLLFDEALATGVEAASGFGEDVLFDEALDTVATGEEVFIPYQTDPFADVLADPTAVMQPGETFEVINTSALDRFAADVASLGEAAKGVAERIGFFPGAGRVTTAGAAVTGGLAALGSIGQTISRSLSGARPMSAVLSAAGGAIMRGAQRVGAKIMGFVLPNGARISRKSAVSLAKRVGIDAAAAALGITAVELAEALLQDAQTTSRRRRKGISYRDLRTTSRVARRLCSMTALLSEATSCFRGRHRRRKKPC